MMLVRRRRRMTCGLARLTLVRAEKNPIRTDGGAVPAPALARRSDKCFYPGLIFRKERTIY